jgi:outer membrane protein
VTSYAIGAEIAVGGWEQTPSGDLAYKDIAEIDLVDEAELEKNVAYTGRIKLDMPLLIPNVYFMYTPMSFEGEGTKSQSFDFGGVTYEANAKFESKLVLNHADLALYYELPFISTATLGVLNAEVGLNVRYLDFSYDVKGTELSTGLSREESVGASVYIPMVYAGVQLEPTDSVALEVEYRGISLSNNRYDDIIARLKVKPFGPLFVAAGYRQQTMFIDEDDAEVDMSFKGPFLEAGLQF